MLEKRLSEEPPEFFALTIYYSQGEEDSCQRSETPN
jgi:hypothetical protein